MPKYTINITSDLNFDDKDLEEAIKEILEYSGTKNCNVKVVQKID